MRFRGWLGALALGAVVMAPSAALAQAARTDDSTLDTRIEARIKASNTLKHDDIDVAVENGVVTLSGKVASQAHRTRAGSLAKIAGVTRVDNKLEIDTTIGEKLDKAVAKTDEAIDKTAGTTGKAAKKAGTETKNAAVKTKDATVKAAKKTGEVTKDVVSETGEAITDAWITTKLKADFVNEDTLKGSSINVDTNNHVVTLKGTVTSEAGRTRAMEIAKTTKGVQRVNNNLIIAPPK
jgi:hyperosmotically inducible periplasmic protein